MPDTSGQDDQIILFHPNPHPLVALYTTSHVKEAFSVENIADLLILVEVFVEEHADLFFIDIAHAFGGDGDLVTVLIGALGCYFVDLGDGGAVVIKDAEVGEIGLGQVSARVMREALITLFLR